MAHQRRTAAGRFRRGAAALVMLAVPLAGCGGRPMAFPVPESEMPAAPGLFTGESGVWEVPLVRGQPPQQPGAGASTGAPR
jgi:hypothetical protein